MGADCLVGESSQLSDKCSIKHSVIGQSCIIGDKVRITNCIIMDNVTIKKEYNEFVWFIFNRINLILIQFRTTLQGSVLMDNAVVENSCDIKDCIVGSGHTVHGNCKFLLKTNMQLCTYLDVFFTFFNVGKSTNEVLVDADKLLEIWWNRYCAYHCKIFWNSCITIVFFQGYISETLLKTESNLLGDKIKLDGNTNSLSFLFIWER